MTAVIELPSLEAAENLTRECGFGRCGVVLVGDGSGSGVDKPAGWACLLYDRRRSALEFYEGGCDKAGIGYAELAAYLVPLTRLTNGKSRGLLTVGLVTDATYVVGTFQRETAPDRNVPLWAFYRNLRSLGVVVTPAHRERNTDVCQVLVDVRSKACRRRFVDAGSPDEVAPCPNDSPTAAAGSSP